MFSREKAEFFKLGMDYYIAGRFATLAHLIPTAGNQIHHAIEMFLKGYLAERKTLSELKVYGHRLCKLWQAFKTESGDTTIDRFDDVIERLDEFETIRYPDRTLTEGMSCLIGVRAFESVEPESDDPTFTLFLEQIDDLVRLLWKTASVNVKAFIPMTDDAKKYLNMYNNWFAQD